MAAKTLGRNNVDLAFRKYFNGIESNVGLLVDSTKINRFP